MRLPENQRCYSEISQADVAQLVERNLAKVEVAGSNPVVRSNKIPGQTAFLVWGFLLLRNT